VRRIDLRNSAVPADEQIKTIDQRIEYLQRRRKELERLLSEAHLHDKPFVSRLHDGGHTTFATRMSR
jgi:hypothetical protein